MTKVLSFQEGKWAKAFAEDREYLRLLQDAADRAENFIKYSPNQIKVAEAAALLGQLRVSLDAQMKRVRLRELMESGTQVAKLLTLHGTDEQIARAEEILSLMDAEDEKCIANEQEYLQALDTYVLLYTEYNKLAE